VNLLWAALIVACVTAVAVAAMLLVRRGAPDGSYFEDGDRAAAIFGILATGFAVLLGFVVFLAFESYDASRSGAQTEARTVAQQFETAQFLPDEAGASLSGELICYARSIAYGEWPVLESGRRVGEINPWGIAMFESLREVEPEAASEQSAYDKWFDQTSERENARADRLHGAEGVIPTPLWIVLLLSAVVIFVFVLFFADSGERMMVQATMMAGVAIVVVATLLLLRFLDDPFGPGVGALQPVAMERTLDILEEAQAAVGTSVSIPCDERGVADGR
jgi:hypothetical protein